MCALLSDRIKYLLHLQDSLTFLTLRLVAIRVDLGKESMSRQKNPSGLISGIPAVYPERPGIEKKVYPAVNPDRFGLGKGVDTGGSVH